MYISIYLSPIYLTLNVSTLVFSISLNGKEREKGREERRKKERRKEGKERKGQFEGRWHSNKVIYI